jgi:DNA-binding transcriptional LysR family regulator
MEASEMPMGSPNKDLEVRHCRALLAVADTGGVAAAARALGVAQSTVSETLLSLERLIGASVTTRRPGRGATLTIAAETLVPHARALVSASEAALAAVAPQAQRAIRLGAVESISSYLLPGPLSAFRLQWPDVDVRIAIGLCEDLRGRVGRSELDAALTIEGVAGRDVANLSPTRLRFVVAPCHPLANAIVTRRDLERRALLVADHAGAFNALLDSWLSSAGGRPRLESAGSIDGVKRGVLGNDAIGVLPDYAVAGELSTHALVALNLEESPPPIALRLTTVRSPQAGSPLDALIKQLGVALLGLVAAPILGLTPMACARRAHRRRHRS